MGLEELQVEHEAEESEEIWLISYADLMTLLFGLFVLMYSFAMSRTPEDVEKVKEGVARSFGGSYVAPFKKLTNEIQSAKSRTPLLQDVAIQPLRNGLEVTFQSGLLFETGSADLTEQVQNALKIIAEIIGANINDDEIVIEGHTDDVPINTARFPSNWELSSVRASRVVREFIKYGFDPTRINAVGFADSKPLVPNVDENGVPLPENRARNRRVVIKIVAPGYIDSKKVTEEKKTDK